MPLVRMLTWLQAALSLQIIHAIWPWQEENTRVSHSSTSSKYNLSTGTPLQAVFLLLVPVTKHFISIPSVSFQFSLSILIQHANKIYPSFSNFFFFNRSGSWSWHGFAANDAFLRARNRVEVWLLTEPSIILIVRPGLSLPSSRH